MAYANSTPLLVLYISRRRAKELPMLEYLKHNNLLEFHHIDVALGTLSEKIANIIRSLVFATIKRPKIILVESMGLVSLTGLMCSVLARAKLVLRLKGNIFQEYEDSQKSNSFFYRAYKLLNFQSSRLSLKYCDLILPISNVPLSELQCRRAITKPVQIVYITSRSFEENEQGNIDPPEYDFIITVTNFNFLRKVQPLVPAIRKIAPHLSAFDLKWIILGDGKYIDRIKSEVSTEIEKGLVEFIGVANPVPYYSGARAHFYFSGMESLSNTLLESYFFKLPVLLNSDFPVMGESAIANETVMLVDLNTDDSIIIKKKLNQILLDQEVRSRLIKNSLDLLGQRFSVPSVSHSLWQAFNKILKSP